MQVMARHQATIQQAGSSEDRVGSKGRGALYALWRSQPVIYQIRKQKSSRERGREGGRWKSRRAGR